MANTDHAFGAIDLSTLGTASKDATLALGKVEDLSLRVNNIEALTIRSEGRLSAIETDLEHLKKSNSEINSKLDVLTTNSAEQIGFWKGVKMTAKASGWLIGFLYSVCGGIIGFLLTKIQW